jgi:hypothetical protein
MDPGLFYAAGFFQPYGGTYQSFSPQIQPQVGKIRMLL